MCLMDRTSATRDAWHPQTRQDRDEILRELQEILASPHFCNSKRYPSLLQYIVENTLAGKSELLKERTLGVEVFDRPPTYDTNTNTVVRYTAGEVRKRLLLYYSEHGRNSNIQILLPAGSYIPEFIHGHEGLEQTASHSGFLTTHLADARHVADPASETHDPGETLPSHLASHISGSAQGAELDEGPSIGRAKAMSRRVMWLALTVLIVMAAIAGLRW